MKETMTDSRGKKIAFWCVVLFVVALGWRVVWAWHLDGYGYFSGITLVSSRAAQYLLEGRGYSMDEEGMNTIREVQGTHVVLIEPLFYPPLSAEVKPVLGYMPGYALVLAAVFSLVEAQYFPVRLVQALVDSAACVLLFLLAVEMLGIGAARVAGVLYALWPPIAVSSVVALYGAFMIPLMVVLLWAVWRAVRGGGYRWWVVSGLVIAVASYFRPNVLLLAPLLAAISFACAPKNRWKSAVITLVLTGVTTIGLLLPWGFYTWQQTGHFLLTSPTVWMGFWVALGDCENPWGIVVDDRKNQAWLAERGYRWLSVEANQFLKRKFIEALRERPLFYAKTCALRTVKVLFQHDFWGFVPEPTDRTFSSVVREFGWVEGLKRYASMYPRPFVVKLLFKGLQKMEWMLMAAAVAGGVLLWRQGYRHALIVASLPFVYFLLTGPIIHVEPRYVLPMEITYVLLASVALRAWWNAGGESRERAS